MARITPGIYKDFWGSWYVVLTVCPLRGTKQRVVVFYDYDLGAENCIAEPLKKFIQRKMRKISEDDYPPDHWTHGIKVGHCAS